MRGKDFKRTKKNPTYPFLWRKPWDEGQAMGHDVYDEQVNNILHANLWLQRISPKKKKKKKEVEWTEKAEIRKAEFLAAGEACQVMFWSTPGQWERFSRVSFISVLVWYPTMRKGTGGVKDSTQSLWMTLHPRSIMEFIVSTQRYV